MKLNLGCGHNQISDYINIDIRPEVKPDVACDVEMGLPYENSTIDEVRAHDFLEHIRLGQTVRVIEEIYRVLKNGGRLSISVPSTDGRGAFQDPTHKSFWNINTWLYFTDDRYRELYGIKADFEAFLSDVTTDWDLKIVHTRGDLYAVK